MAVNGILGLFSFEFPREARKLFFKFDLTGFLGKFITAAGSSIVPIADGITLAIILMILLGWIEVFEGEESSNNWLAVNFVFGEPGYNRFSCLFFLVVLVKDGSCVTLSSIVELSIIIRRIDVIKKVFHKLPITHNLWIIVYLDAFSMAGGFRVYRLIGGAFDMATSIPRDDFAYP